MIEQIQIYWILIGLILTIKLLNLMRIYNHQIYMFKSFLTWVYDLATKYNERILLYNLPSPNFFPKIRTSNGEDLNTPDKLINWMNNLYQKNISDSIISYNDLIPISELRSKTLLSDNFQT